jgi:hypothetical protein
MSYFVRPDHPKGTGQLAQAAASAFLHIKRRLLSLFVQGTGSANHGAASLLTVMAEDRN